MHGNSIVLTKGHRIGNARSQEEVEAVRELHKSLSLREIGLLYPDGGISHEAVRKMLNRDGKYSEKKQIRLANLDPVFEMLRLILSDETVTSFYVVGERTGHRTSTLKKYLKEIKLFHRINGIFDRRRENAKKTGDIKKKDTIARGLQGWAIKIGHNPSMTELFENDSALCSEIGKYGGIRLFRQLASLPQKSGVSLPEWLKAAK